MPDHHAILDLPPTATSPSLIKQAYRQHVLLHHPDKNRNNPNAHERTRLINEAYKVLKDKRKREQHEYEQDMIRRKGVVSRAVRSRCFEGVCYLTPRVKVSGQPVLGESFLRGTYQAGESIDFLPPVASLVLLALLVNEGRKLWSHLKSYAWATKAHKNSSGVQKRRASRTSSAARSRSSGSVGRRGSSPRSAVCEVLSGKSNCSGRGM